MKFPFKDESKTEHNIKEDISVSWEYAAIGEMIHQALGESRMIHERDKTSVEIKDNRIIKTEKIQNPDVDKIKNTADYFLDKAFDEYKKERLLRFSFFFISKLFFTLYLTLTSLIFTLFLILKNAVTFKDVEIILFILTVLVLVILFLINQAKETIYKTNNV